MQAQHLLFFPLTPFSQKKKVWHHDKSSNYGSWNHRVFMFLLRSLALGSEGCAALFYTSHAQCNKVKSVVEFKLRSSKLILDSNFKLWGWKYKIRLQKGICCSNWPNEKILTDVQSSNFEIRWITNKLILLVWYDDVQH